MKRIILTILLFTSITSIHAQENEPTKFTISNFNGLYDLHKPWHEMYPPKFSPALLNVKLDRKSVRKREGYVKYNQTALNTFPVRNMWVYYDVDESISYHYAVCGSTIYYTTGSATYSVLYSTISATNQIKFINYASKCYIFNIDRNEATMLIVDGTSVTTSTNVPTGTVSDAELWLDRAWVSIGSILYRSATFDCNNWTNPEGQRRRYEINTNDGQKIRALKAYRNFLYGFKDWTIFMVSAPQDMRYFEDTAGVQILNTALGCIYPETVCIRNGLLTWFGNTNTGESGIYESNGQSLNYVSEGIPDLMATIGQTTANTFSFEDTTETDFDAGTHTSVDIETTSGDVVCLVTDQESLPTETGGLLLHTTDIYQSFRPKYTTKTNLFKINIYKEGSGATQTVWIRETTASGTILSTATITPSGLGASAVWYDLDFSPTVLLTAEATYFLRVDKAGDANDTNRWTTNANDYSRGSLTQNANLDMSFKQYTIGKSTFYSQVHDLTSPISFGVSSLAITDVSEISTTTFSVSADTYSFVTWNDLEDGVVPAVTALQYAQIRTIFNKTSSTHTASIQSYGMIWNDTRKGNDELTSGVFKNNYWTAYEIDGSTINTRVLYYDKYNNLIPFTGMHGNCFIPWYDKFYMGSSDNNGFVYELNKADTYTDNGADIEAYYRTKTYNLVNDKFYFNPRFISAELVASDTDFNVDIDYRLDYNVGVSTTNVIDMDSASNIITKRFDIFRSAQSRFFDIQVGDTSSNGWELTKFGFQLKRGARRLGQ